MYVDSHCRERALQTKPSVYSESADTYRLTQTGMPKLQPALSCPEFIYTNIFWILATHLPIKESPKPRTVTGHTAPAIGSEPNWFQGGLAEIESAKHYQRHHDLGRPANHMHTVEGILRSDA